MTSFPSCEGREDPTKKSVSFCVSTYKWDRRQWRAQMLAFSDLPAKKNRLANKVFPKLKSKRMKQTQQSLLAAGRDCCNLSSNQELILVCHCKAYLKPVRPAALMASKINPNLHYQINNKQLAQFSFSFSVIGDMQCFSLSSWGPTHRAIFTVTTCSETSKQDFCWSQWALAQHQLFWGFLVQKQSVTKQDSAHFMSQLVTLRFFSQSMKRNKHF